MRGSVGLSVFIVTLVAATAIALPVSAHVNHVSADPQLSTDGTVLIETVFIASDGWLVLHAADGGEIGKPIGHVRLDSEGGLKTDVPVTIDSEVWERTNGSRAVYAALHHGNGDGSFDPEQDTLLRTFGEPAATRFTVEPNDVPASVLVEAFSPEKIDGPAVTLRTITLPADGHIVLRNASGETVGPVVGSRPLAAARHDNVTVEINHSFYRKQDETFTLTAVAYDDDSDTVFDEGDEPITAGGERVSSTFALQKTGNLATATTDEGSLVNTPSPTTRRDDSGTSSRTTPVDTAAEMSSTTTETAGPGFGVGEGFIALVLTVLLARRLH